MIKVYINPNYGAHPDKADGGIRRVVEAQKKHLPKFGIEIVDDPKEAARIIVDFKEGEGVGGFKMPNHSRKH